MAEENGVWRTIFGRRVFIEKGQDLTSAMKKSGKFKNMFGKENSESYTENNDITFTKNSEETKKEISDYINEAKLKGYKAEDVYGEIHITDKNSFGEETKSFSSHYGKDIETFSDIYKNKIDYISLSLQRGTDNKERKKTINIQK